MTCLGEIKNGYWNEIRVGKVLMRMRIKGLTIRHTHKYIYVSIVIWRCEKFLLRFEHYPFPLKVGQGCAMYVCCSLSCMHIYNNTYITCRYDEALADFEQATRLNHLLPSPHVLAGLIHMNQRENIDKAVECFSAAINVDPTCIRAYLCRAEAYKKDKQVERKL